MLSKTPLFDAALETRFSQFVPGTRTCPETGASFELTSRAIERYKSLHVPPSKIAPWARIQRMRASASGFDLFRRTLLDGASVVTMYVPESPAIVMPTRAWYDARTADAFSAHARVIDPTQPFFSQWKSFSWSVPRPALIAHPNNENSEWTNYCFDAKNLYNCYSQDGKDMVYSQHTWMGSYSADVTANDKSEWCCDCLYCEESSHLSHCDYCVGCMEVHFSLFCLQCSDCFGCANLRSKRFCFMNKQLTEQEYRERLSKIDLKDARVVEEWSARIKKEVWDKAPRKSTSNRNAEDCQGDGLVNCKEVVGSSVAECERCQDVYFNVGLKDCADFTMTYDAEWSSYCQEMRSAYQNKFSQLCNNCIDVEYCELLQSCEHCFGCIGFERKKFCVFNKQYTEEEYWPLVDAIKTAMLAREEYGEFPPYECFLTAYSTSHANYLYPLDEEEAKKRGARWYNFAEEIQGQASPIEELPYRLDDFTEDLFAKAFRCPVTGRPFRIVKPELELHKTLGCALPRVHPIVRGKLRMSRLFQLQFYTATCARCQKSVQTRIPPFFPAPVFCETCFDEYMVQDEALIRA